MRMPFDTGYLYALDHVSSVMSLTSPYFVSMSRTVRSGTSGRRFAIVIRFVVIPASSIFTIDNSPLTCLNSICPFVSWRRDCTRSLVAKFMKTCHFGPSNWIMRKPVQVFSPSRKSTHECGMLWYVPSQVKTHTNIFHPSFFYVLASSPSYTTTLLWHHYFHFLPIAGDTSAVCSAQTLRTMIQRRLMVSNLESFNFESGILSFSHHFLSNKQTIIEP